MRLKHEQDTQDKKDNPAACIDLRNNQSELSRKFLMSQMQINGTESTLRLYERKLKEMKEQMIE